MVMIGPGKDHSVQTFLLEQIAIFDVGLHTRRRIRLGFLQVRFIYVAQRNALRTEFLEVAVEVLPAPSRGNHSIGDLSFAPKQNWARTAARSPRFSKIPAGSIPFYDSYFFLAIKTREG